MDILKQYKQEHPEAFQEKKSSPMTDEYGRAYTGMIAFVMRISGGRIRDMKTASYALAVAAGAILLLALLFFFGIPGFSFSPKAFVPAGHLPDALPR